MKINKKFTMTYANSGHQQMNTAFTDYPSEVATLNHKLPSRKNTARCKKQLYLAYATHTHKCTILVATTIKRGGKYVLKYFVANMRAKLKIMQRIKNLTSAYPLSATPAMERVARGGGADWFADCGLEKGQE